MRLAGVVIALLGIIGLALAAPAPAGAQSPPAIPTAGWSATFTVNSALQYGDRIKFTADVTAPSLTYAVCVSVHAEKFAAQTGGTALHSVEGFSVRLAPGETSLTGVNSYRLARPNPQSYPDGRTITEYAIATVVAYHPSTPGDCFSSAVGTVTVVEQTARTAFTYVPYNPATPIYTQAAVPTEPAINEDALVVVTLENGAGGSGGYCFEPTITESIQGGASHSIIEGWRYVGNRQTTSWSWTYNHSELTVADYTVSIKKTNEIVTGTCAASYSTGETSILTAADPATLTVTWRAVAPTTSNELSVNISAPFPTVQTSSNIIATFENTSPHTTHYCYKVVIRERGVDLYQSPYYVVQGGETKTGGTDTNEIADLVYSVIEPDVVSRTFQVRLWRSTAEVEETGSPPAVPTTCTFNELNAAEAISAGIGTVTISWRIGPGSLSPDDGECPTCFLEYQPVLTSPPLIRQTVTPGTYEIILDWTPISPSSTGIERTEYEIIIEPDGIPIDPAGTEPNGGTPTIARNDDEATAVITYAANNIGTDRRQVFIRAKWYTVAGGYPFPRTSGQVEVVQGNQYIYSGWGKYYIFLTGLTPYTAPATPTPVPGAVAMHERGVRPQARAAADGAVQDAARLFIDLFTLYEYDPARTPNQNAVAYQAMQVEWQSYLWAAFTLVITLAVAVTLVIGTKTFTATSAAVCTLVFILLWFFGGLAFGGFTIPFATIPVSLLAGAGGVYWWTNR